MSTENDAKQATKPVLYWCPTARQVERHPGGGFDTCCHAPELHEPVLTAVYATIRQQVAEQIAVALEAEARRHSVPTAAMVLEAIAAPMAREIGSKS